MNNRLRVLTGIGICLLVSACVGTKFAGADEGSESRAQEVGALGVEDSDVMGFGIFSRLPGLWHGPVTTTTPAGSFDEWYVDFRPVAPGQVSQYSTLDASTLNYMSFFIVERDGKMKIALRTEGVFMDQGCVTYEVIDCVDEERGFYRFSDFKARDERAYTEFRFSNDEMVMEVYTNKFNRVSPLELHTRWKAKLGDRSAAQAAIDDLGFPRPVVVKDFTYAFENMSESIYYVFDRDPYPSGEQPYVGSVTVDIEIDEKLPLEDDHELFLLLTTESLFDGLVYDPENLRFASKYAYLPVGTRRYTFANVHPGRYYLYAYNDVNGDKKHKSGDYIGSDINNIFTLAPEGHVEVSARIDYVIP